MITFKTPKHHWNYYLAIEQDLEKVSRYIEFAQPNLPVYSIELAHILLSASSEIDVLLKQVCTFVAPGQKVENIDQYRNIIVQALPNFSNETIQISRYDLSYQPWDNWPKLQNPDWWRGYNRVKHERNNYYHEACLQHTINAVGALLLTAIYYYNLAFSNEAKQAVSFKDTTHQLQPSSAFITIAADYYYEAIVG